MGRDANSIADNSDPLTNFMNQGYKLYKQPGSPYWTYRFKLPGQPQVRVSTKSTDEKYAHKVASIARGEALQGKTVKVAKKILVTDMLFAYLSVRWPDPQVRKKQEQVIKHLLDYFKSRYAAEVTSKHVDLFKAKMETYLIESKKGSRLFQKTSINKLLTYLRAAFNLHIKWGDLHDNPIKQVETYKQAEKDSQRTRFLTQQEKDVLLGGIKRHVLLFQIVSFALRTGMRRGEILSLKWSQIDWQNNQMGPIVSKRGNKRFLDIHEDVYQTLEQRREMKSEYVFSYGGKPINKDSFKNTFMRWVERLELKNLHFHDLRHTFASDYLQSGGTLKGLMETLGHTSMRMTIRYAHLSKEFKQQSIMVMPSLVKKHHVGNVHKLSILDSHPFTHPLKVVEDEAIEQSA